MDTGRMRSLRREFEGAGIQFVRENEPGKVGPRIGAILARSTDDEWIAIGDASADSDIRELLRQILDAIALGQL